MAHAMNLVNTLGIVAKSLHSQLVPGETNVIDTSELSMSVVKSTASDLKEVKSPSGGGVEGLGFALDPNSTEPVVTKVLFVCLFLFFFQLFVGLFLRLLVYLLVRLLFACVFGFGLLVGWLLGWLVGRFVCLPKLSLPHKF